MVAVGCFKQARLHVPGMWGLRLAISIGLSSAYILSVSRTVIGPASFSLVVFTVICVRSTVGETLSASGDVLKGAWVGALPTSLLSLALVHLIPPNFQNLGAGLHLAFVPVLTLYIASVGVLDVLDPVSA
jgi:hypothetical protein